eukprot:scaffold8369_cov121-Cylindrotheca_fusiformis.AAC.1
MAVDEFGREVLEDRKSGRRYPSPPRDGAPSHLFGALPTSRYAREDRSSSNRKRKHRSESPPRRKPSKPHPSTVYAEAPMLCQYLWKEANPDKEDDEYDEYRRAYCLNYVRTFFNEHMDDSWFRSLYSPLEKYRVASLERERSLKEAHTFLSELNDSLEEKKPDSEECFFVLKARLGGGVKQPSSYSSPSNKKSSSSANLNPVPLTHVHWCASQVLPIQEVPPHVTDEQLTMALMSHCTVGTKPSDVAMYSSAPAADLSRSCYFQALPEVRKDIINNLNHLGRDAANAADGEHVPRKEDTFIPKTLDLEVDCSDAYGRLEIDSDGKGGAPEEGVIPPRKAVVCVSTEDITPPVKVLSVAVSSKERIAQDKEAALKLAAAYDEKRNIPAECRLDAVLPLAIPGLAAEEVKPQDIEDALDISIAYLRRVHLFSFYNGCVASANIADVFNGTTPASTIHLRLANADNILQQTKDDNAAAATAESDEPPKVDLLVQRLDNLIEKALSECKSWDDSASQYLVSKEVDKDAKNIEEQEARVEDRWIQAHALIDEDGRARCSFHFCRKLFKDSSFLKKHLMKKHTDFLKAEIAKCHDTYMMKSWDQQEQRPVPPILVDCGRAFSTVPSPVLGAADPLAADPEPELWRRQEERRKLEEEEEQARRERYQQNREQNDGPPPSLDGPLSEPRGPRQSNFVDVDDMKEENVEMAFDKVEIPVQPTKKKKKKKKLL